MKTIEQVRDWHRKRAKDLMKNGADPMKLRAVKLHQESADAIDAHLSRQSEVVSDELPDDIRVPLDEVRADLGYLFGRVAADGSFMQAAVDSVRLKLDKVRAALTAIWHNRPAQSACPFCGKGGMHPLGETCLDNTPSFDLADTAQEKCSACDDTGRVESTDGGVWNSCYKCGKQAQEKATNYVSGRVDSTGKFHATAQEKAEPVAGGRLPKIPHELYEMYPPMSAQNHAEHVRAYARLAIAAVTPPAEHVRVFHGWRSVLERALPFLDEEADKYDDDGNNEPKDVADSIRDLLNGFLSESMMVPAAWLPIDTLECEHNVVLLYSSDWIDAEFNPEGIREGFRNEGPDGPILSAKWLPCHDCWTTDDDSKPSHWLPLPIFSAAPEASSHG